MTERDFLASDEFLLKVQKARQLLRVGGGVGKVIIELDFKDDRFQGGGVDTRVSSGRMNAKHFAPE